MLPLSQHPSPTSHPPFTASTAHIWLAYAIGIDRSTQPVMGIVRSRPHSDASMEWDCPSFKTVLLCWTALLQAGRIMPGPSTPSNRTAGIQPQQANCAGAVLYCTLFAVLDAANIDLSSQPLNLSVHTSHQLAPTCPALLKNPKISRSSALMLMLKANTVRVARSNSASSRSRSRCMRTSGGVGERLEGARGRRGTSRHTGQHRDCFQQLSSISSRSHSRCMCTSGGGGERLEGTSGADNAAACYVRARTHFTRPCHQR